MKLPLHAKRWAQLLRKRPAISVLFLLTVSWLSFNAIGQYRIHHPHYEHAMTSLTKKMQTHCFGRLQIDLPAGSRLTSADAVIDGVNVSAMPGIPHEEFIKKINARWRELQAMTKDSYGRPYLKPSARLEPIRNGVVFTYEHTTIKGSVLDGEPAELLFHQSEGYLWRDDVLFSFEKSPESEDDIAKLMERIEVRQTNQMPDRPGLCFGPGFVMSEQFEPGSVHMSFDFPGQKEFGLIVTQNFFTGEPSKPLLQRRTEKAPINQAMFDEALKRKPSMIFGEHKYRFNKRVIGTFDGEEVTVGSTEKAIDYSTGIGSEWEYIGKPSSNALPAISLNMGVEFITQQAPSFLGAFPSKEIAPNALTEEEYFALWDAILKSLRPRPVAPSTDQAKPKQTSDMGHLQVLPLGTQVSSLRSCPETGTYECSSDTLGVAQRRVFIQQGRPMPSAFTDAPKNGISGFFGGKEQQEIEMAWTLVSYERDA